MISSNAVGRLNKSVYFVAFATAVAWLAACDTGLLVRDRDVQDVNDTGVDAIGVDRPAYDVPEMQDGPFLCNSDMDCQGSPAGTHCDLSSQMCRPCVQNPNTCPNGMYCDATFTCVRGCSSDLDCAPADAGGADGGVSERRCDVPNHVCVQCLGDLDCPSDLVCRGNQCLMGCSATRPCPGGASCCDGACTDLLTSSDHCGSCSHRCDAADTCCGGICYGLQTDPRHCGTCASRCSMPNATASCALGACTVGTCVPGYGDCDGNPVNGCETNFSNDPMHCGTCGNACPTGPNVVSTCDSGVCHSTCAPGYLHCSMDPTVGCEVNPLTDPNNCGVCGNVCTGAHVTTGGCVAGACTIVACAAGYTDCNGAAADGCESNITTDVLNCGACFHVCPTGPYSSATCTTGACGVTCLAGHGNCDGNATNGCEADFSVDPNHCGNCGTACMTPPNATSICSSGSCAFYCNGTFQNCNGLASDGCEANLISDVNNCGACHNVCSAAHATVACTTGACTIATCAPGFANCNGSFADGCETPTTADPLNCGGCNVVCASPPFATGVCSSSACSFTCLSGHADCDHTASNGCEVTLATSVANCGACGNACPTPPNATPTCGSGACGFVCNAGFSNCDGVASNGCEVNLATSTGNCGTCGHACSFPNSAGVCLGGACQIASCTAGYQNCDGTLANGCETNISTDSNNCGACLNVCPTGIHGTSSCSGGTCGISCAAGYGNCNGSVLDGCEVTYASDPAHCGSCSNACPTPPNTVATCSSATCGYTCLPGFRDCNGLASDGCEVNITSSATNCGGCGSVCTAPNTSPACVAGACTIGTCNSGYRDCNGLYSDGCETNVNTNSSNCGACGNVCTGGTLCVSGACTLVNPFPSTGTNGPFSPTTNTVLTPGVYNFTTINIPAGVTVTTNGTGILDLRATGAVTIGGIIDVSGGSGGNGVRPTGGGGGGFTAMLSTGATATVGTQGSGGSTPAGSNASGCGANGLGGTNGGGSGALGTTSVGGGGGGGPAGGAGGLLFGSCVAGGGGGGATAGAGGQAGGAPYDGAPGQSGYDPCGALVAGGGGGSIGSTAANDLGVSTTLYAGSGGGGGSGAYSVGLSAAEGGGGGGGGAIRISSSVSITILSTGQIRANGGAGGNGSDANTLCSLYEGGAGGGGGSGGTIYLAAPSLSVAGGVQAAGGLGGHGGANVSGGSGGNGGLGRIRITTNIASCSLTGSFTPSLRSACGANTSPGYVYIAGYPF